MHEQTMSHFVHTTRNVGELIALIRVYTVLDQEQYCAVL